MKVNRKSTPNMVVRPYFTSEYQRLQRQERTRERAKSTVALMVALVIAVILFELVIR